LALSLGLWGAALGLLGGCPNEVAAGNSCATNKALCTEEDNTPPEFSVDPPLGVGFDCVVIGCDDTRLFTIENTGGGNVALPLVRLSVDTSTDFSLRILDETGQELPAPTEENSRLLAGGHKIQAEVRYQPSDAEPDSGQLWVDWFDGKLPFADAVIERVELPISSRVLGDASAGVVEEVVNFGFVEPNRDRTKMVQVQNTADGDAVLEVTGVLMAPGSDLEFTVEPAQDLFVNPGDVAEIPVRFAPTEAGAYAGAVLIATTDGANPQLTVNVVGTSVLEPTIVVVDPADGAINFGEVRQGEMRTRDLILRNGGGQPLILTPQINGDGQDAGFEVTHTSGNLEQTVPPLGEVTFAVNATPTGGGELAGELTFFSNDPAGGGVRVSLAVNGAAPELAFDRESLDFGNVVQGWTTESQSIFLSNQGTGELTISELNWELGSSGQVRMANTPMLPIKLDRDDPPLEIAIYVQAQTLGPANATLLVHTDSVSTDIHRFDVSAEVVTCADGCPVINGGADCSAGMCEIGTCDVGWHDADTTYDNGCECREDNYGNDIGATCSDGELVGTLHDDCEDPQSATRDGTLHSGTDMDVYYFQTIDHGCLGDTFGDSSGTSVEMTAGVAGLALCARIQPAGAGCGGYSSVYSDADCKVWNPGARPKFKHGGSYGSDDNRDTTVWVMWHPDANPVCASYSLRFRGDD
jgi:hypothetical protein